MTYYILLYVGIININYIITYTLNMEGKNIDIVHPKKFKYNYNIDQVSLK